MTSIDATSGSGDTGSAGTIGEGSSSFLPSGSHPPATTELRSVAYGLSITRTVGQGLSEKRDSQGDSYSHRRIRAERLVHRIGGFPDAEIQLDGSSRIGKVSRGLGAVESSRGTGLGECRIGRGALPAGRDGTRSSPLVGDSGQGSCLALPPLAPKASDARACPEPWETAAAPEDRAVAGSDTSSGRLANAGVAEPLADFEELSGQAAEAFVLGDPLPGALKKMEPDGFRARQRGNLRLALRTPIFRGTGYPTTKLRTTRVVQAGSSAPAGATGRASPASPEAERSPRSRLDIPSPHPQARPSPSASVLEVPAAAGTGKRWMRSLAAARPGHRIAPLVVLAAGAALAGVDHAAAQSPSLVLSESSLEIVEGADATYSVRLATQPSADVIVSIGLPSPTVLMLDSASLTFTSTTWSVPQDVTVTASQDATATDESETLTHTAAGGGYDSVSTDLAVSVSDTTPVELQFLGVLTSIQENGGSNPVAARLDQALSEDLTVTVSAEPASANTVAEDFTLSANRVLTIAAGSLYSTGEVVLISVDNHVKEETPKTIRFTATVNVARVTVIPKEFLVINDDHIQLNLKLTPAQIFENGGVSRVTAEMSSLRGEQVTLTVSLSAVAPATETDFVLSGSTLTFPPGAYRSVETLTITATDNSLDEPDKTVTVMASVTEGTQVVTPPPMDLTIVDDEGTATVALRLTPDQLREGSGVGISTVTAELSKPLSEALTITVSAAPGSGEAASGEFVLSDDPVLAIAAGQTSSSGTVTIAAVDDGFSIPHGELTVSGTVAGGTGIAAPLAQVLAIRNDDGGTVLILEATPGWVDESTSGVSTITMRALGPVPADVTLTVSAPESDLYTMSANRELTIAAGATASTGTVTLTVVNDDEPGSNISKQFTITGTATASYRVSVRTAIVYITEDDRPSSTLVTILDPPVVWEDNGVGMVTAVVHPPLLNEATVTVSVNEGSTNVDADKYELSANRTLTIPAGSTHSNGTVTLTSVDDEYYGPLTFGTVRLQYDVAAIDPVHQSRRTTYWNIKEDESPPVANLELTSDEMSETNGEITVTATLSVFLRGEATITVQAEPLGSTLPGEFVQTGTTLTIAPGSKTSTGTVKFTAVGDSVDEPDRKVRLWGVVEVTGEQPPRPVRFPYRRLLTIADDDAAGVTVNPASLAISEGGSDSYTVVLDSEPSGNVTVSVSGFVGSDVLVDKQSLTFTTLNWSVSQTVTVSAGPDIDAIDDSLTLTHTASGGGYDSLTADLPVTVVDDETASTAVTLLLNPSAVAESASATSVTVTAGLNAAPFLTATNVTVSVTGGTAVSVTDYAAVGSFTVTIPSGQASGTAQLSFDPAGDSLAEGDETVILSGSATGLTAGTATLTITDDDTAPTAVTLSLNPNAVGESAAATAVTVTAGLNGSALPTPTAVTVSVTGGTAVSVTDYAAVSSFTVTIPSGQTSATAQLSFDPAEDSLVEGDETVILSGSATGLTAGTATLTITDNDTTAQTTVTFGASSYTASEGAAAATVAVDLSTAPSAPVTILLTKAHLGGATEADYSGVPLSVTFTAGQTRRTFTVTATDDSVEDGGERVRLGFRTLPVGFELGARRTATVALTDNDGGEEMVTVNFAVRAGWPRDGVEEGISYSFHFLLDRKPGRRLTIPLKYTYLYGATAGDFGDLPAAVTFGKNQRHSTVSVPAAYDFEIDPGEALRVSFGTLPAGVKVGSHSGPTTILPIVDTDGPPGLSVTDASAREWPGKRVCLVFVVKVDQHSVDHEVRVDYATADGTAFAGQDYKPVSGTLVFRAGQREKSLCVEVIYDSDDEGTEEMTLRLSNPVGAYLSDGTATGHISNKDRLAQGLSVAGPLLALGYPGALDAGSQPSPRDFVVAAEAPGGARAMVAVTAVTVRGSDVVLELDRPVTPDETVTLTYLAAAMHPIRDVAGLPAAPLADEPVRNDTGASGPLAEPGLAAGTAIPAPLAALLEAVQEGAGTERLDLSSRNLTDVSALAGLTGLQALDLRGNAIADLSPLAGLTGLRELDLSGNRIADLWPLAGLAALQRLDLADNRIADIATLAELTGLLALDLSGNRIADLWPLAGLAALQRLNLTDNRIADIATLAGLSGLEVLLLDRNRVADVQALSQLAGLANLGLSDNRIADIGLLAELGGLRRLDLSGNAVADVSALGDVSGLVWLRLPGNPVSNAAPLGRLEKLRWLWLDSGTAPGTEALAPPAGRGAAPLWIERTSAP